MNQTSAYVNFDLTSWNAEQRTRLDRAINPGVPRTWSDGQLIVYRSSQQAIDAAFTSVGSTAVAAPGTVSEMAWDLTRWPQGRRDELTTQLARRMVPFGWRGDHLVVPKASDTVVRDAFRAADLDVPPTIQQLASSSHVNNRSSAGAARSVVRLLLGLVVLALIIFVPYRINSTEYKIKCAFNKATGESIGFPDGPLCSIFGF